MKDVPAKKIEPIVWPEEITAEATEMRPGFITSWRELVKVAERKAPHTDLTDVHMALAGMYIKRKGTEIHEKALLLNAARATRRAD